MNEEKAPSRPLRSTMVYEALREEIIEGVFAPGVRLATRALATRFEVSDIPVREALWMLEREGLIENIPFAGARVRVFDEREIEEAYEARGYLEALAIKLGAGKLTDEQVAQIQDVLDQFQKAMDRDDLVECGRLNRQFHELTIAGCPNSRVLSLIKVLWDAQASYQMVFRLIPERTRISHEEHVEIARAVIEGDGERAAALIVNHRRHSASALSHTSLTHHDEEPASEHQASGVNSESRTIDSLLS